MPSADATTPTQRVASIDIVKAIAMVGVIGLHTTHCGIGEVTASKLIYYLSSYAIPLFFIAAGWLQLPRTCTYRYCIKKVLMILRFVTIIAIIVHSLHSIRCLNLPSVEEIFSSIIFCYLQIGALSVFWFFGALSIIYLSLPILNRIYNNHPRSFLRLTAGIICIQNLAFLLNVLTAQHNHPIFESTCPQTLRLWEWYGYFCIGGLLRRYPHCFRAKVWHFLTLAAIIGYMGVISGWWGEYFYGCAAMQAYAIIIFLLITQTPRANNPVITAISSTFLFVYAFHLYIAKYLAISVRSLGISYLPHPILFVLVTIISVGVGILAMRIPGMKQIFRI